MNDPAVPDMNADMLHFFRVCRISLENAADNVRHFLDAALFAPQLTVVPCKRASVTCDVDPGGSYRPAHRQGDICIRHSWPLFRSAPGSVS